SSDQALGIAYASQIQSCGPHRRNLTKTSRVLGPIAEITCGNAASVAVEEVPFSQLNQLIRFRKIERPPKHRVGHAENRHVDADAQREREHGHGGEAGVLQQLAEGEFEIIHGKEQNSGWFMSESSRHHSVLSATIGSTLAARR